MKIAKVIGTVTLSRAHPSMQGIPLRAVEILADLSGRDEAVYGGETVIACDLLGSGVGDRVALAEGPESAQPFYPEIKPIDANTAAILDSIDIRSHAEHP
ncbi:EutN/CcmL family microcompartment protein [Candidatus Laterigemmans baculatus]|uniref:EutN/CcmL family microcompartment protein n=1 Tax=Candidatus Laterigemmans baculatus TaxID=2770505 RepID=UPI0013DD4EF4|nr:EutN/CcmL family microcompartment protein [Candidatus Laterigemmans baculatus]